MADPHDHRPAGQDDTGQTEIELSDIEQWLARAGDIRLPVAPDVGSITERARQRVVRRRIGMGAIVLAVVVPGLAAAPTLLAVGSSSDVVAGDGEATHLVAVAATAESLAAPDVGVSDRPVPADRLIDAAPGGESGRRVEPVDGAYPPGPVVDAPEDPIDCSTADDGLDPTATPAQPPLRPTTTDRPPDDDPVCVDRPGCGGEPLLPPKVELVDCRPENETARPAKSPAAGVRVRM